MFFLYWMFVQFAYQPTSFLLCCFEGLDSEFTKIHNA